jgi:hypothetical protein
MPISRKSVFFILLISLSMALPAHISLSEGDNVCLGRAQHAAFITVGELTRSFGGSWQEAFAFVRDEIRFEPTIHLMKTAQGVLWGRSGNAREQSLLLAEILRGLRVETRMAAGRLSTNRAADLIGSLFPEKRDFSYTDNVPLSQPLEDESLIARVSDHVWIQIKQDGQWLDLDPCFPDAKPGTAYSDADQTFTSLPDRALPRMMISMSVQKGGAREDIFTLEQGLHEMVNLPVTLSISTSFAEGEEKSSGGSVGGAFGGLSGGASGKKAKKGLVATYKAALNVKEGMEAAGEFTEKIPEKSQKLAAEDILDRIWLTFRLTLDGRPLHESERVLFEKNQPADEFPLFQRHSILIAPNAIPLEAWEGDLSRVTDARLLKQVKSAVDEIKKSVKSKKDKNALLDQSLSLEEKLGRDTGHLINMIFAYSSDSITADSGEALSVLSYYTLPRIVICSVEGDGKHVTTVMDLRQDSIEALPYPGQALGMTGTFQYGRGVFESVLEGKVLELFLGKRALTTSYIMQEASKKKIPVRLFSENEKAELEKLGMPEHVSGRALKAMAAGAVIVIPERSIRFDGQDRWGWWQVDPKTQEVVGVLDTGLHQAMIQRTILDTEGMLNSKMGFAIGAITGAVDTQWMLASMILQYGEINKAALQEIKAYMKQLKEYMCPEFEKSVSVTVASVSVSIEDCFEEGYSWSYEGGVKVEMGWCQAFAKGFACASTSILNYYLSQYD